ncbi:MAG: SH3 beta-barrel fold-containing protein [Odoribacter sp.]|nr:SH3 beta-barrel fold-containing protein [Odoribacter sp.]
MKTFRTKVFNQAYEVHRNTGEAFGKCLAKAWDIYRLEKKMNEGIVDFSYIKTDGSFRKAKGTLKEVKKFVKGEGRTISMKVLCYFDVDVNDFRSFRIENLVDIYN